MNLEGKILVAGAGISGVGVAQMLVNLGADVTVVDGNETALARACEVTGARGISLVDAMATLADFSLVVTSPGWRPSTPLLVEAAACGIEVVGDVELCYRLDCAEVFGPKRTWMVITGTNGKTTTTAMLAAMMVQSGAQALAVGNIGVSVAEALQRGTKCSGDPDDALDADTRVDVLVAELSSFQLHWSSQLRPDVGVLLNLAEDHIDWHGSMEEYATAKAKVLKAPIAIAGIDDEYVRRFLTPDTISFTLNPPTQGQLGISQGHVVDCAFGTDYVLASCEGIQPPGPAGLYDALAAAAAARAQGVSAEDIAAALASFTVAGHRGQIVAQANGVIAIDNSKATNPHAADSALAGHESVVWVAGGQLKGAEVSDLVAKHAQRLKAVGLLGVDREVIARAVDKHAPHAKVMVTDSTDPVAAMDEVCAWAAAEAVAGDAIVLAPAAASLDMYTGMGQRGELFTEAISKYLG
ncbi:UDP-N-acetylmuramoyl-L-alanine--D-glutamate ligase [Corynebacterium felinum]|uniref:UDP-N-acetylmuramoylalanine--D-glutamate ligase n=1 Tax=Corynebacterium felinum TaxID=131318 RepID=A0ABU2BC14_9CORY|nr:UDP-N-acetylmuramoyl-L-alanine--D-glutamate ligase [Corynebacterium felinum]MDF5820920.1 UDP-N-acetylmuramoyl-L-alanine--D-glutamate ligase [Corynebacterium felinum]MDR7356138.1 UDP-N-acetylmuramoylalanine--D-glutamate ligase [Corynebacterium felinum]WJY95472.1 UDP-N-acetylmuramoylalanine--D-glutamate ligase [Corynebacterium felinum]